MHAPTWRQRWEDNYPDLKQELTTAAQKWQTKTLQSAENEKLLLQSVAEYEEIRKTWNPSAKAKQKPPRL